MSAERAFSRIGPSEARLPIGELDVVRILVPVQTDEGETIAAGTEGTVVAAWAGGAAFDIEFAEPVLGLATVRIEHLARTNG